MTDTAHASDLARTGPQPRNPVPGPRATARRADALLRWLDVHEAPTWALILATYGGFAALTYWWTALPAALVAALGAYLVCLQAHLTHEILHGHPTRRRWLNELFAWPPLGLWIPYPIYRDSHLAHHRIGALTCPIEDPESFYHTPDRWRSMSAIQRRLLLWNQSLLGRLTIGPALMAGRFWAGEIRRILAGDRAYLGAWAIHLGLSALVLIWIVAVCGMPLWFYLAAIVYPALSLGLLRSYVEHRPGATQDERCCVVEGGPLTQLLFLNNNFHIVHHSRPGLPWHRIPAAYRADRDGWLARNGGYRYRDYWQVARRCLLRPKDGPVHPTAR